MARVKDADGVGWHVRRVWWPFGPMLFDINDTGVFFWIGTVLTAPFVIAWPFWLLARVFGAPWTIRVTRGGQEQRSETVRGFAASGRRIAEIVAEIARPAGEPRSRAVID